MADFSQLLAMVRQAASQVTSEPEASAGQKHSQEDSGNDAAKRPAGNSIAERYSQITGQPVPDSILNSRLVNFSCPGNQVGRIIGKGGETIHRLIDQAHCHIQVSQESRGDDRYIALTGTSENIETAKMMILKTLEDFQYFIRHPCSMWDERGSTFFEVIVSPQAKALFEGEQKQQIDNIQSSNGVLIEVKDQRTYRPGYYPVVMSGDKASVQRASSILMNFLTMNDKTPIQLEGGGAHNAYGTGAGGTRYIDVPKQFVGYIIGKGGETIKKLSSDSGTKVQFDQNDVGQDIRKCIIQGQSASALDRAEQLVKSCLAEAQSKASGGLGMGLSLGMGSGMGGGMGGGYGAPPPPGGNTIRISVPADKAGLIIGKGGETIKSINSMTGARVDFDKTTNTNPVERYFNITGLPSQIQAAQALINEKITPRAGGSFSGGGRNALDPTAFLPQSGFGSAGYDPYAQPAVQQGATAQSDEQRKQWEQYWAQMAQYNAFQSQMGGLGGQ